MCLSRTLKSTNEVHSPFNGTLHDQIYDMVPQYPSQMAPIPYQTNIVPQLNQCHNQTALVPQLAGNQPGSSSFEPLANAFGAVNFGDCYARDHSDLVSYSSQHCGTSAGLGQNGDSSPFDASCLNASINTVPYCTQNCDSVPNTSRSYEPLPYSTQNCDAVPHTIKEYELLPYSTQNCEAVPYSSKHCKAIPSSSSHSSTLSENPTFFKKRRNSERRKEKSRDAARCRRSLENDIFNELASLLPIQAVDGSHLDKASIIRLAITHLRNRNLVQFGLPSSRSLHKPKSLKSSKRHTSSVETCDDPLDEQWRTSLVALDGFLLVLSADGEIVYTSENISTVLGLSQVDIVGQHLSDYVHPCDHEEINRMCSVLTTPISRCSSPFSYSPPTHSGSSTVHKKTDYRDSKHVPSNMTPPLCLPSTPDSIEDDTSMPSTPPLDMPSSVTSPSATPPPMTSSIEDRRETLFLRFKCTITPRGRSVNLKSASYKVVRFTFRYLIPSGAPQGSEEFESSLLSSSKQGKKSPAKELIPPSCGWVVALAEKMPHPSSVEIPLEKQAFVSRHSLDMKFTYVDENVKTFCGYDPWDLMGVSFHHLYHALDAQMMKRNFITLHSKGQVETGYYRFLANGGGYAWVVTQATLISSHSKDPRSPQCIICLNYVVSEVKSANIIFSDCQLKSSSKTDSTTKLSSQNVKKQTCDLSLISPPISPSSNLFSKLSSLEVLLSSAQPTSLGPIPVSLTSPLEEDIKCEVNTSFTPENSCSSLPFESLTDSGFNEEQFGFVSTNFAEAGLLYQLNSFVNNTANPQLDSNKIIPSSYSEDAFQLHNDLKCEPSRCSNNKKSSLTPSAISSISNDPLIIDPSRPAPPKKSTPVPATCLLLKKRTEDMNEGYVSLEGNLPFTTALKQEPEDLTHLAPSVGDGCVPVFLPSDISSEFDLSDLGLTIDTPKSLPLSEQSVKSIGNFAFPETINNQLKSIEVNLCQLKPAIGEQNQFNSGSLNNHNSPAQTDFSKIAFSEGKLKSIFGDQCSSVAPDSYRNFKDLEFTNRSCMDFKECGSNKCEKLECLKSAKNAVQLSVGPSKHLKPPESKTWTFETSSLKNPASSCSVFETPEIVLDNLTENFVDSNFDGLNSFTSVKESLNLKSGLYAVKENTLSSQSDFGISGVDSNHFGSSNLSSRLTDSSLTSGQQASKCTSSQGDLESRFGLCTESGSKEFHIPTLPPPPELPGNKNYLPTRSTNLVSTSEYTAQEAMDLISAFDMKFEDDFELRAPYILPTDEVLSFDHDEIMGAPLFVPLGASSTGGSGPVVDYPSASDFNSDIWAPMDSKDDKLCSTPLLHQPKEGSSDVNGGISFVVDPNQVLPGQRYVKDGDPELPNVVSVASKSMPPLTKCGVKRILNQSDLDSTKKLRLQNYAPLSEKRIIASSTNQNSPSSYLTPPPLEKPTNHRSSRVPTPPNAPIMQQLLNSMKNSGTESSGLLNFPVNKQGKVELTQAQLTALLNRAGVLSPSASPKRELINSVSETSHIQSQKISLERPQMVRQLTPNLQLKNQQISPTATPETPPLTDMPNQKQSLAPPAFLKTPPTLLPLATPPHARDPDADYNEFFNDESSLSLLDMALSDGTSGLDGDWDRSELFLALDAAI